MWGKLGLDLFTTRTVRRIRQGLGLLKLRRNGPIAILYVHPVCQILYGTDRSKVGFDLVNIQLPLKIVEHSIAKRIEWIHGNLCVFALITKRNYHRCSSSLTTKLPFEDDEFDHVHIQAIAKGVPENKVRIH